MTMLVFSLLLISFSMNYYLILFILLMGLFSSFFMLWGESRICSVSFLFSYDLMSSLLVLLSLFLGVFMFLIIKESKSMMNLLTSLIMTFLVLSFSFMSLMGFYLSFEAVLIPTVMLIVGMGGSKERIQAGMYMLFYTVFGSLPLLVGLVIMSDESLNYLYLNVNNMNWEVSWWVVFLFAFLIKLPMFFVHLWLPKAHVEAPVEGSMILAGVLLKLGCYGIFRVISLLWGKVMMWSGYFISVGLVGGLVTSLICLRQNDMKSLIAYSSVGHMGLVLAGMMVWLKVGVMGGILMMLGHGVCSSGLFYLINLFYERFHSRSLLVLKGMMIIFPSLAFWWFIFSIINMSAPPSLNLMSELLLLMGMVSWSSISLLGFMLISFFCAVFCVIMFSISHHGGTALNYFSLPLNLKEFNVVFLHFFPLVFMIFKVEVLLSWIYL
uniref:NADH-ubiquinone oxidoreductase chain 4 n=1 Tax=Liphistius erawan TaxID=1155480 RepID=L7NW43_LIPER|nr:NADH dehydrogenase subunit 4 [Liphistius erawan]AFC77877.1 NADH dehydrogenase subunit 4 [Liphistius erawan]